MTNGSPVFLVDTNVLVYAYDPTDGTKRARATEVLTQLGALRTGSLSVQVMGEFFTTVTRKIPSPLTDGQAERTLANYARSWTVYELSTAIVLEAIRGLQRYRLSYWDALIWATAKLNQVPYVLTEDMQHGQFLEGVRFQDPFAPDFDPSLLEAGG